LWNFLGEEIAMHVKEQQDLTKAMFEAQEIRMKEKAENEAVVKAPLRRVVLLSDGIGPIKKQHIRNRIDTILREGKARAWHRPI